MSFKFRLIEPSNSFTVHKSNNKERALLKCYNDMLNMGCKHQRRFVVQDMIGGDRYEVDLLSIGNNGETIKEELDVLQKKQDREIKKDLNIETKLDSIYLALNKPVPKMNVSNPDQDNLIVYDLNPYITNIQKLHSLDKPKQSFCNIL